MVTDLGLVREGACSPDGAKRNPGSARRPGDVLSPDYASLHPGYEQASGCLAIMLCSRYR